MWFLTGLGQWGENGIFQKPSGATNSLNVTTWPSRRPAVHMTYPSEWRECFWVSRPMGSATVDCPPEENVFLFFFLCCRYCSNGARNPTPPPPQESAHVPRSALIPVNEGGCVAPMHQAKESLIKSHSRTHCHTCAAHA